MFESILYGFRLKKLQKQKRELERDYERKIKEVRGKQDSDEEDRLILQMFFEKDEIDDEIYGFLSRNALEMAERYFVPRPQNSSESVDWIRSKVDGSYRLSETAISNLRAAIRKKKKSGMNVSLCC